MESRGDRARAAAGALTRRFALRAALIAAVCAVWPAPRAAAQALDVPAAVDSQRPLAEAPQADAPPSASFTFSSHAMARMLQRGVNMSLVEHILDTQEPFRYYHQGRWKQGYYDPDSRLFIATADRVVITVITDASPRYVARLKRSRPK